jgi:hypothetical protein
LIVDIGILAEELKSINVERATGGWVGRQQILANPDNCRGSAVAGRPPGRCPWLAYDWPSGPKFKAIDPDFFAQKGGINKVAQGNTLGSQPDTTGKVP